ncbi:tRNA (adenosine(37)-N6)-dimethylallyltransferase MiaA [Rhodoblastus acidophilus]|uniref:tRNA (adenosine(37)-N6)-dimethylallyltransferase MiaA n=1 Tax=Rhodoblastus acidophilus TaxID=1074 RepID=UPI000B4FDFE1|nr:tRNA (adenosine(37)-N6)-dimethylallyltransferase MiaA [Rhodoblastus acidophilus]PPQ38899.1 tRNA (adenosine(37)-N6)-dimethylallyltransferase MiaA [Rhodoblastus acidophilus]RAI20818.1 tRNA (adenosine(37)-N6)-dimethylallyltransferase MiaA [Rhodoblastus acidophilus]
MGHAVLNAFKLKNRNDLQAVLIAGPTASGKTALAAEIAEKLGAAAINADSMQVYGDLPILSAQPTAAETARAPHMLFGHIDAESNYSVGRWLDDARAALADCRARDLIPVFVGGTGMYFKALLQGLSDIPAVPPEVRARVRAACDGVAPAELHARLSKVDPETAARLRPTDPQRLIRALEIFEAFQAPLARFQGARQPPLLKAERCQCLFLAPERPVLNARIDARFDRMMEAGALEEVFRLRARGLDRALPALRAVGAPGLLDHLDGACSLEEAVARGKRDSRHYAKRQFTFARTQLPEFQWIAAA